jgi:predicted DNA-binding transcriptional regulator AlpA
METPSMNAMPEILRLLEAINKSEPLLIYRKKAEEILGVGTTKFYELMKLPTFPKPKIVDGKRPMYLRKDVEDWALSLGN